MPGITASDMFLGSQHVRLDDKYRLTMPAKHRPQLSDGIVITKGQERCLYVYPIAAFAAAAARRSVPGTGTRESRDYDRVFFASAWDFALDASGRTPPLPGNLRTYAGLDRDCAVNGDNERLEIWNYQTWKAYEREQDARYGRQDRTPGPGTPPRSSQPRP